MKPDRWVINGVNRQNDDLLIYFNIIGVDKYIVEFDGETNEEISRREVLEVMVNDFIRVPLDTSQEEIDERLNAMLNDTESRPRPAKNPLIGREGRRP